DKNTQRIVREWYHNRCPLTGAGAVHGTHIVNIQAMKSMDDPVNLWETLQVFWPLKDLNVETLDILGQENRNILPLHPLAHHLWDRNKFGLRLIEHPTEPKTKIYLQVNWFKQRAGEIERENRKDAKPCATPFAGTDLLDTQRELTAATGVTGREYLQHGDVYMLYNPDCAARPLPNIRFLEMRYAVQQLFAGQQTAEALRVIFGGDAPDDEIEGPDPDEAYMPADWDNMITDAYDLGILDDKKEQAWRQYILRSTYRRYLNNLRATEPESEGGEGD
ncbi:uncharacterized protein C8A04DRAFT_15663, partial [Dichotomopilus funicola]